MFETDLVRNLDKIWNPPTVVGIYDLAWRRGQRCGTIICYLGRNCVLDLLLIDSVARWPGIKVVARDRAYRDSARCGASDAVANRCHMLDSWGEDARLAVGRHHHNVAAV